MTLEEYKEEAVRLFGMGLTCIPLEGKVPLLKEGYRERMPVEVQPPLDPDRRLDYINGIGVLCGAYSGGFVALDFDLKNGHGDDFYATWCGLVEAGDAGLWSRLVRVRTKSGGRHVYFRTLDARPTKKLARTNDVKPETGKKAPKDLIEYRSTGGYVIPPPSSGYEWEFGDMAAVPTLTTSEVDFLCDMALCLDEFVPDVMPEYKPKSTVEYGPDTPFNRYDRETSGADLLEEYGFRRLHGNATQVHFNRPGAKNRNGVDATWYRDENKVFFFSSSVDIVPDTDRCYRPYQILVFNRYGGEWKRAAGELAQKYNPPVVAMPPAKKPEPKTAPTPKEPFAPGPEILDRKSKGKVDVWIREQICTGVEPTELQLEICQTRFPDVDPAWIAARIPELYEALENDFNKDNDKGAFAKALRFIEKNYIIRRNTVTLTTSVLARGDRKELGFNADSVWNNMQKSGVRVSKQQVQSIMNDPQMHEFHDPFIEYFEGLGDRGTGHIERLASYVRVDPYIQEFWTSMFRKAMIRTVAGAVSEYANRECIVLCSKPQKIGKTWFISNLSPWGESQYFSAEPIIQNKDQQFRICQNLLYLLDEMGQRATNEKHSDYLKMLLSKKSVNERRTYEIDNTTLSRKVTFWGTSNSPYLFPGQNTRFISIPVQAIDHNYNNRITGLCEVKVDDVWAEAYRAYMDGEPFELTASEMEMQEELNSAWVIGGEAIGLIGAYVEHGGDWLTAEQILHKLGPANPNIVRRLNAKSIIEALRYHGFQTQTKTTPSGYKMQSFYCTIVESGVPLRTPAAPIDEKPPF